jgi:hypothetical protein
MKNSTDSKRYANLKNKKGDWVVREDAFIRFRNKQGVMTEERADDASGLNAISHKGIVRLSSDLAATENLLRETLERARTEKLSVVPFGARRKNYYKGFERGEIQRVFGDT